MAEPIEGKIKASSEKAIFLETENHGEMWIPKSQIDWLKNGYIKIYLSDFIANAKGLITNEEYERRKNNPEPKSKSEQEGLPF